MQVLAKAAAGASKAVGRLLGRASGKDGQHDASDPPNDPDPDLTTITTLDLTCGRCGGRFASPHPISIDVERRPEALDALLSGALWIAECDHCLHLHAFRSPMLLITRSLAPHLFFLCEDRLARENANNFGLLAANLRQRGGSLAAQWLSASVQPIEFRFLRYLLQPFARPEPGQWIAPLQWQVLQYVQVFRDTQAVSEAIDLYPELVWAAADEMLGRMENAALALKDDDTAGAFRIARHHLGVIRLVNGINIDPFNQSANDPEAREDQ